MEIDTDYVRSDFIENNGGEVCGLRDRVWDKIEKIRESNPSYSGRYMVEYIFYHLRDNDQINSFDPSDFRDLIREQRYIISKSSFNRWWNGKIEKHKKWKDSLNQQDIILRKEKKHKGEEKTRLSARLSICREAMDETRKYF